MKVKKGDIVLVISGKDRGKTAKILASLPKEGKILVEGANMVSRHIKPRKQGEKGQVVKVPSPIHASAVKIICPACKKATRVGYIMKNDKKYRACKKCASEIR